MKTAQQSVYGTGIASDGHTLNRGTVVDNERLQNFSVDTQLQSKFATGAVEHTLLTGVDFMRMRNDINATFGSAPSIDLYNPYTPEDFTFGDAAPYQLNETKQTGDLRAKPVRSGISGSLRWVAVMTGQISRRPYVPMAVLSSAMTTSSRRGGVNYLFDNGIAPYISYSQSFEPNAFDLYSTPRMAFAPSKGEQYEAGVRYVPKDMPIVLQWRGVSADED